ncbi:hypothetical protein ACIREE_30935 [Streptomyces sp. NPDC102467]|uniref:hypothetical protein n=1 Tax=Streptomyces sp. NPDC102467 TaxID=3366179 RepID=UPI003827E46B
MTGMRQIESDEARRIVESGTVRPLGELLRIAEARHEGGRGGLGLEYGRAEDAPDRYLFATEVEDADGMVWSMLLDAHTGEIIEDRPPQTQENDDDAPPAEPEASEH